MWLLRQVGYEVGWALLTCVCAAMLAPLVPPRYLEHWVAATALAVLFTFVLVRRAQRRAAPHR